MSIKTRLKQLEANTPPLAQRFIPISRQKRKRRLFLVGQAMSEFNDKSSAVNILVGRGNIAAALTLWSLGGLVYGNRKRGVFLDDLEPPPEEIWEVRVTSPTPQARVLGCFAEPDTLVLCRMHTRPFLGDKGSQAWADAMNGCSDTWSRLFPHHLPFSALTIHEYVTENCDDYPIKRHRP